jgi:hypothetical protein
VDVVEKLWTNRPGSAHTVAHGWARLNARTAVTAVPMRTLLPTAVPAAILPLTMSEAANAVLSAGGSFPITIGPVHTAGT